MREQKVTVVVYVKGTEVRYAHLTSMIVGAGIGGSRGRGARAKRSMSYRLEFPVLRRTGAAVGAAGVMIDSAVAPGSPL